MDKKYIRFIDSDYNTLFYVENGESVRIRFEDGDSKEYVCRYIDETHAHIGNNVFHICEFAERMERYGRTYEPVKEIGDLEFYAKRYFDRKNLGDDGMPIPYFALYERCFNKNTSSEEKIGYAFCLSPASENKTFCKYTSFRYKKDGFTEFKFARDISELCGDDVLCDRINNIVKAIKAEQKAIKPALEETIAEAKKNAMQVGRANEDVVHERDM